MADLVFSHIRKEFVGGVVAVEDFSLTVPSPRMVVLVGPSGCGKTTLLRMVAGLETPSGGTIHLDGERLDTRSPRDRDIAMVFQSYALYPHMTVAENLSFGLRVRRVPKAVIAEKVRATAKTLELDALLHRRPAELSGGQRQRVALGRAIIREPRVFLFDEPLSNLDARLRTEMRTAIRRLYDRLRVTSVYVTHDQVEAMTIGEVLVVMNQGRVHQVGAPEACYQRPADSFVATFLGSPAMNMAPALAHGAEVAFEGGERVRIAPELARVLGSRPGAEIVVGVRPEDLHPAPPAHGSLARLSATLTLRESLGHETLTHLRAAGIEMVARGAGEFAAGADGQTSVFLDAARLHIFWKDSGRRVEVAPEGTKTPAGIASPA